MNNLRKKIRTFTISFVSAATVVWSFGLAAFVPVASAQTTVIMDGDVVCLTTGGRSCYLIKGQAKHVFPHANVYSWYHHDASGNADFSNAKYTTEAVLAGYTDGAAVRPGPGQMFRGTAASIGGKDRTAVFFTLADGTLRPIKSEAAYQALFNDAAWSRVTWVPDDLLTKFPQTVGEDFPKVDGSVAAMFTGDSLAGLTFTYAGSATYYYIKDGKKRAFASLSALTANGLQAKNVVTLPATVTFADGDPISGVTAGLNDPVPAAAAVVAPAPAAGGLNVSISPTTPAGITLPLAADGVALFSFVASAVGGAATLSGVTVHRVGIGAVGDFDNVYLYEGATRLTSGRTISSTDHTAVFTINKELTAGESKTYVVRGDISSTAVAGNEHLFEIASTSAVDSTATISGSFPVRGNNFRVGGQAVSTLTIDNGTNPGNPSIGAQGVAVATIRFTAGTNDVSLSSVTLAQAGTVSNSDLTGCLLERSSATAATATVSGDKFSFVFTSGYAVPEGTTHEFNLKCNVAGRSGRTIVFYVENAGDVIAIDKLYTANANITITAIDTSGEGSSVTTQGGKVTISLLGPAAKDVSAGAKDQELLRFNMATQTEGVEVKDLDLSLQEATDGGNGILKGSSGTDYFTDFKVVDVDTGKVLTTTVDASSMHTAKDGSTAISASATVGHYSFADAFIIAGNTTKTLKVTADVTQSEDAAADEFHDEAYTVSIQAWDASDIREVSTSTYLTTSDIVPNSAVTGNNITIQAPSLTVTLGGTPTSNTYVKSSKLVPIVAHTLEAGRQGAVKITQIVYTGQGAFDADSSGVIDAAAVASLDDVILSATLWDGVTQLGLAKSPSTSGTFTFDNLNFTIPAGGVKSLTVKVDAATSITNLSAVSATAWLGINAAADISAYDPDSNAITPTDGSGAWDNPINSTPTVLLTVANAGSLSVQNITDPVADIVLGGTSGVLMKQIRITSAREAAVIKKLRFTSSSSDEVNAIILEYLNSAGTSVTSTVPLATTTANFNDLDLYIGKDKTVTLKVKVNLATVESGTPGADSGDTVVLTFDYDGNCEVIGQSSNATTTSLGSGDLTSSTFVVRKSRPVFTVATSASVLVSGADKEVFRFTVGAEGGDVAVKKFTFGVNITDISTASIVLDYFKIYATDPNTGQWGSEKLSVTGFEDSAGNDITGDSTAIGNTAGSVSETPIVVLDTEQIVSPGKPISFAVKATVAGVATTGDTISTSLYNSNDTSTLTSYLIAEGTGSSATNSIAKLGTAANGSGTNTLADIIWSDMSVIGHSDTEDSSTLDWTNGRYLKNLTGSVDMSL